MTKPKPFSKYLRDQQLTRDSYGYRGTERRIYPDGNKLMLAALSFQKRGFRIEVKSPSPSPHYAYHYTGTAYMIGYVGDYELTIYFHVDDKGKMVP